jgi:hypothetical protein
VHLPHRSRLLLFANTLGRSIVAVCFTHRFQPEYEFATDTIAAYVLFCAILSLTSTTVLGDYTS